jgi:hypothetical protein
MYIHRVVIEIRFYLLSKKYIGVQALKKGLISACMVPTQPPFCLSGSGNQKLNISISSFSSIPQRQAQY